MPDPLQPPLPADQFCDLVMEGGVTSGVVYPKTIVKLSTKYMFHSIGGTSAGAIAAAVTAAAEYRRRVAGDSGGFTRLDQLPETLAPAGGQSETSSQLFKLFTPQPGTAAIFAVVASVLNQSGGLGRGSALILGFLRAFWPAAAAGAGVVLVLAWLGGVFALADLIGEVLIVLLAALSGLIAALANLLFALAGPFVRNNFGLCRGYTSGDEARLAPDSREQPVTLWLSRLINECAGLPVDGPPLTFGMLWGAPGFPPAWLAPDLHGRATRSINLQTISTSLTHSRPFRFPDADDDVPLYIDLDELAEYFPPNVVACLRAAAVNPERAYPALPPSTPGLEGKVVLPLANLPVVVAARMSLSFPVLLSAVPLYSVQTKYDAHGNAMRQIKRCWFSDGGLTSNFPIHFFDAPLPLWPTFGISLESEENAQPPGDVWMPPNNVEGRADPWDELDPPGPGHSGGFDALWGFISALLGSIRNWQDRLNARLPGVRDRVVRVRLTAKEGGLNLAMPAATIAAVAKKGALAGDALLARYAGGGAFPSGATHPMDLDNHRWVRLRALVGAFELQTPDLAQALDVTPPATMSWADLIAKASTDWASQHDRAPITAQEAPPMKGDVDALRKLATAAGTPPGMVDTAPKRQPVFRLGPRI